MEILSDESLVLPICEEKFRLLEKCLSANKIKNCIVFKFIGKTVVVKIEGIKSLLPDHFLDQTIVDGVLAIMNETNQNVHLVSSVICSATLNSSYNHHLNVDLTKKVNVLPWCTEATEVSIGHWRAVVIRNNGTWTVIDTIGYDEEVKKYVANRIMSRYSDYADWKQGRREGLTVGGGANSKFTV